MIFRIITETIPNIFIVHIKKMNTTDNNNESRDKDSIEEYEPQHNMDNNYVLNSKKFKDGEKVTHSKNLILELYSNSIWEKVSDENQSKFNVE